MRNNTIFVDFDNSLFNTDKALIRLYEERGMKTIDDKTWKDATRWDYTDILDCSRECINELFKSDNLYTKEDFFDGIVELFKEYSDKGFTIIVASIGNPENSINKIRLINEVMPYAIQMPTIHTDVLSLKKNNYDMTNCVFLDDSVKILNQTNATNKILAEFGKEKEKSIGYEGIRATSVEELSDILKNIYSNLT